MNAAATRPLDELFEGAIVVNIGVRDFADSVAAQQAPVVHVAWTPPFELEEDLAALLEVLG